MLDTDICSYAMRQDNPKTVTRFKEHSARQLKVSVVSVFELEYGVRRSPAPNTLETVIETFLSQVEVLPFDFAAARQAAGVRAKLAAAGNLIGQDDMLIAGHALSLDATLVTNNTDQFGRVEGLRIENWAE